MTALPLIALSVRQPWAHAIIHCGKDIENRSIHAVNRGGMRPARIAIHAAKGMTRDEYEDGADWIRRCGHACPAAGDLPRGGIIGAVTVSDIVKESGSPWFFGPRGLVLRDPEPCDLIPAVGQLGFFKWSEADALILPAPARWMLREKAALSSSETLTLFEDGAADE